MNELTNNNCVCCGAPDLPEGRMVCPGCEAAAKEQKKTPEKALQSTAPEGNHWLLERFLRRE